MRRFSLLVFALGTALAGCAHGPRHITVDSAVLGRVVIYRNGVAFYERTARVADGRVSVKVPRDRVDDFLKSLTVVDPHTRKPLAVSIPRQEADDGSYLTMTLETGDKRYAEVLLTYVTESPAWKPSYRVVVGGDNKVMLEGWAIVDNVSGEDWNGVLVGVGASSALSFRYDLWSVRRVDRDLLQGEDRFAVAPPTGVSPYTEATGAEELVTLGSDEVRGDVASVTGGHVPAPVQDKDVGVSFSGSTSLENTYYVEGINTTGLTSAGTNTTSAPPASGTGIQGVVTDGKTGEKLSGVTVIATSPGTKQVLTAITDANGYYSIGTAAGSYLLTFYYGDVTVERSGITVGTNKVTPVYQKLRTDSAGGETIQITATAPTIDQTSASQTVRLSGVTVQEDFLRNVPAGRTFESALGSAPGSQSDGGSYKPPPPVKQGDAKLAGIVKRVLDAKKDVVIETHGPSIGEVQKRAEAVRNKLVDDGVPAGRIHVVPKVGANEPQTLRVLAVAPGGKAEAPPPSAAARAAMPDTPVGESHFMADRPMNVRAGTSAMVAMVHGETSGGVVYLYDPISDRGDERFAFKAVRLDNPTDDTLEPGPVTVYGDGRFIGEGITEPVPPKASVVVPFALDRQILISRNDSESDRIAKLVTVQRGIVTAEVQHRRQTRFTVTSRLTRPTKVYLRHRLETGWSLVEAPSEHMKVGDSQLFEVTLGPGETKYVTIAEATPVERSLQLGSAEALDMMKVYIDEPEASPELKKQIGALLETHKAAADLEDKIVTLREELAEYRARAGELHAQVVTLKLVKTGGELMSSLKSRLAETSDHMQKTTLAIVDTQEKLMLARLKFGNQLADLHLTDALAKN
jgi:hypothetical protein